MEALRVTKPNNKIVILTKRDLADKYMPLYKTAGFKVYDLDFSNPEKGIAVMIPGIRQIRGRYF